MYYFCILEKGGAYVNAYLRVGTKLKGSFSPKVLKGIGLYCSVQLFGMQKLLFDWNFKPRAFLGSPGPPLLVGSSIHLKSL